MAKQKLNYTQGDAEPKKKANQKRSQLATGQSTGDVSQVDLSFKTPQIQNFRWYGNTYSTPTEPKLVPTLDLPSVEGFYDDTKKAKSNEFGAWLDSFKTVKGELAQLPGAYTEARVKEQAVLNMEAAKILDTYQVTNDGTDINPADKLQATINKLNKIINQPLEAEGEEGFSLEKTQEIEEAKKILQEIESNRRLRNTITSLANERKVLDNLTQWDQYKLKETVDEIDDSGNKVQLRDNEGELMFESDGVTPIYAQVTLAELDPSDPRYKEAYNNFIYKDSKLGIFEHNNLQPQILQHRMNDRANQTKNYNEITTQLGQAEIVSNINLLENPGLSPIELNAQIGKIVASVRRLGLTKESEANMYKLLWQSLSRNPLYKNLDAESLYEAFSELALGTADYNGIAIGPEGNRWEIIDGVTRIKPEFAWINTLGGTEYLREIVENIVTDRDNLNKADKTSLENKFSTELQDGVKDLTIEINGEQVNLHDALITYDTEGTPGVVQADTTVRYAYKLARTTIEENYQRLREQIKNSNLTETEKDQQYGILEEQRKIALTNLGYGLTGTEFTTDVKLLEMELTSCNRTGNRDTKQCRTFMANYSNLVAIYGETLVNNFDRTKGMMTKYNNIQKGSTASVLDGAYDDLQLEFIVAVKAYNPSGLEEGKAQWASYSNEINQYLTDTYSDLVSAAKDGKVTKDDLMDKVRMDIQNGTFARIMRDEYKVDIDNSLGKNFFYPSETNEFGLVEEYGPVNGSNRQLMNRLDDIKVEEIFPGTDDYELVNHLDSPQPYLFNSKGSIQFVKNILFGGETTYDDINLIRQLLDPESEAYKELLEEKGENNLKKEIDKITKNFKDSFKKSQKGLEVLFEISQLSTVYNGRFGDLINDQVKGSILTNPEYAEAITKHDTNPPTFSINWSHPSIPKELQNWGEIQPFLESLNGLETYAEVLDKIEAWQLSGILGN
tara:strand:- start:16416 stop:19286 length:2871 start_codon:yes stop_codon:yes gene_type:complete